MQIVSHAFAARDLVAGHHALDFVNTMTARDAQTPIDWLDSYARLLDWAALSGLFPTTVLRDLRAKALRELAAASRALERARRFREAFHLVVSAALDGEAADARALADVERLRNRALSRVRLAADGVRFTTACKLPASGFDLVLDSPVIGGVDLLCALPQSRLRRCKGVRCGWLFIDTSKGGRRAWCDMATCGNAAKALRHRRRERLKPH